MTKPIDLTSETTGPFEGEEPAQSAQWPNSLGHLTAALMNIFRFCYLAPLDETGQEDFKDMFSVYLGNTATWSPLLVMIASPNPVSEDPEDLAVKARSAIKQMFDDIADAEVSANLGANDQGHFQIVLNSPLQYLEIIRALMKTNQGILPSALVMDEDFIGSLESEDEENQPPDYEGYLEALFGRGVTESHRESPDKLVIPEDVFLNMPQQLYASYTGLYIVAGAMADRVNNNVPYIDLDFLEAIVDSDMGSDRSAKNNPLFYIH